MAKPLNEADLKALLEESGVDSETTEKILAKNKTTKEDKGKRGARGHGNIAPQRTPIQL